MILSRQDIEFFYSIAADMFPNKAVPKWISEHPAIRDRQIKKVFPSVGLPNFKEKIELLPGDTFTPTYDTPFIYAAMYGMSREIRKAEELVDAGYRTFINNEYSELNKSFDRPLITFEEAKAEYEAKLKYNKKIEPIRNEKEFLIKLLDAFNLAALDSNTVQGLPDGRVRLVIANPINVDGKTIIRQGEPTFRAYGKIKDLVDSFLKKIGIPKIMMSLDNISAIKEFNSKNIPMNRDEVLTIVFSSAGEEGAWDIATMSERGIRSCQSWESEAAGGEYRPCLVGSVASNYVGIIYLTSGKDVNGKGSKMIRRCAVRFGIDMSKSKKERKPVIILDKMYDSYNQTIVKLFLDALRKRSKFPVLDFTEQGKFENIEHQENIKLPAENLPEVSKEKRLKPEDSIPIGYGLRSYQDNPFEYLDKDKKRTEEEDVQWGEEIAQQKNIKKSNRVMLEDTHEDLYTTFTNLIADYKKKINPELYQMIETVFYIQLNKILGSIISSPLSKKILIKDKDFVKRLYLTKCLKLRLDLELLPKTEGFQRAISGFDPETRDIIESIFSSFRKYIMEEIEKTRK